MANLKHIGRVKSNKKRAIVAYRTLPGDPYSALVIMTESLPSDEHDALIAVVESSAGQEAYELAEAMMRSYLPDGRNMLAGFHATGKLRKVPTSEIEMVPNMQTIISLDELNNIIAQQRGVGLEDLAVKPNQQPTTPQPVAQQTPVVAEAQINPQVEIEEELDDISLARKLRSHADAMFKEAQKLRAQAEKINPTKKTTKKVEKN